MTDALSIALSGLNAQKQRLAASASNIANATTGGSVPNASSSTAPSAPASASTVYKPLQVNLSSVPGGVQAETVQNQNGYSVVYDPSSSFANNEGLVAVPDVDLAKEAVNLTEIKILYKANLSVMKTQDQMMGELLDIVY